MSITPYITSSIVIQLLTVAIPALERHGQGGRGRAARRSHKITRYATVVAGADPGRGLLLSASAASGAVEYTSGFSGVFAGIGHHR